MFNQLIDNFNRLDSQVPSANFYHYANTNQLRTDIVETDKAYNVNIEVPGIERDSINVDFDNGILAITVTAQTAKHSEHERHHLSERIAGATNRRFRLPAKLSRTDIKAKLSDGVLHLTIAKPDKNKLREQTQITVT